MKRYLTGMERQRLEAFGIVDPPHCTSGRLAIEKMKRQNMKILIIFLSLFICVSCSILPQSPYRQALPQTASDIKEYRSGVVDFTYLLRAKVTENEFSDYVKLFGLLPDKLNEMSEKNRHLNKERQESEFSPSWWSTIRPGIDIVFEKRDKADIISAKYNEGFLFLHVTHI